MSLRIHMRPAFLAEMVIPSKGGTAMKTAQDGDEFFTVLKGYVECESESKVAKYWTDDHFAVPDGGSYILRNPSLVECKLSFVCTGRPDLELP